MTTTLQADVKYQMPQAMMNGNTGTYIPCIYTQKAPLPIHPGFSSLRNQRWAVDILGRYLMYSSISTLPGLPSIVEGLGCPTWQSSISHTYSLNPFFVCVLAKVSRNWYSLHFKRELSSPGRTKPGTLKFLDFPLHFQAHFS